MLAETVQIDGGTLVLILLVVLFVAALALAVIVFGFILAPRAGRGSSTAMGWWIVILAIESLYCVGSVASVVTGDFTLFSFLPPAIVAGQVALYLQARRSRP